MTKNPLDLHTKLLNAQCNLLEIQCPKCKNFDALCVLDDGHCVNLGPWLLPEDLDEIAWLTDHCYPDIPVMCEACGHLGPFATFDGGMPAQIREARLLSRFRDLLTQELPFDADD